MPVRKMRNQRINTMNIKTTSTPRLILRLLKKKTKPFRVGFRAASHSEANRLLRNGWELAPEEDKNLILSVIFIQQLDYRESIKDSVERAAVRIELKRRWESAKAALWMFGALLAILSLIGAIAYLKFTAYRQRFPEVDAWTFFFR